MAKKYVVFDLDGTLIDSIPDLYQEINLFLADHGRRPLTQKEATDSIGFGARNMLCNAFRLTGEPLPEEEIPNHLALWIKQYSHARMDLTRTWPGVPETLARLKDEGFHMAVCTNKPEGPTDAILKKLDLARFFEIVLHADSLPVRKPRPEPLWEAVRRMGGTNSDSVMVGDSEADAEAARNAGFPIILLSFGYAHIPLDKIAPDVLIDSFGMLPDVLKKL